MPSEIKNPVTHRHVLTLFLALGLLYYGFSWMRPLASPDEPRYGEIPREMLASGDWVAPRLNGILYFQKPPLFYWLVASAEYLGGLNNFAMRFWPAAFGLFGCLAVYLAGKRLYDKRTGLYAAAILGTTLLYFAMSQLITLDMTFSMLMSAALLCLVVGQREVAGPSQRKLFYAFYAFIALAVMTKGLLAIMLPGAIIFLWFVLLSQWEKLRRIYLFSGIAIVLAIALPWHVIVASRHPEWFDFYILHEQFLRYLSNAHNRGQPIWFFVAAIMVGMMPWISFLPQSLKTLLPGGWKKRQEHSETWFLLIWAVFVLFFFSLSKSKLFPYILPVFPPLALIIGRFWASLDEGKKKRPNLSWGYLINGVAFLIITLGLVVATRIPEVREKLNLSFMPWVNPASLVVGMFGVYWLWKAKRIPEPTIWPLFAGAAAMAILANPLIALFQPPTIKPIVTQFQKSLKADDLIFSYEDYFHDLPLYLKQTVGVIEDIQEEQSFGLSWEDHTDRYMKMNPFRKIWGDETKRVFVVMGRKREERFRLHIKSGIYEVAKDENFMVFTNIPLTIP
ncbi:glycosyltransferase family 39 protein [soil metagenome]